MDELLLRCARQGDARAFEALIAPLEDKLWRLCWHYAGREADAADCLQETMLKLWRSLPGFRGDSTFETWAYRLCVNCCLDLLRRRTHRAEVSAEAMRETGFDPPDPAPGPEDVALRREQQQRLRQAVADLPDDMRTALILTQMEGRSYDDAAEIMQVKTGTVKSRVNRAREKLAALFSDDRELSHGGIVQQKERRATHDLQ